MRYFIVKIEARGRTHYAHIEAADSDQASKVAMEQNKSAISTKVLREIDRAEFDRLTKY